MQRDAACHAEGLERMIQDLLGTVVTAEQYTCCLISSLLLSKFRIQNSVSINYLFVD